MGSVIGGLLDPFESRLDKLAATYDRDFLHNKKLKDFAASGPRIYLNSTNLVTGNMFFFVSGGNLPSEIGEHELGVIEKPDFLISQAVAASSAFPPVFPPLKLNITEYASNQTSIDYVTLTDGGVYDNLGINPALRERNKLDYLIVSDGGKPFTNDLQPTESGTIVLKAALNIIMEQVRGLEFDRIEHRYKAGVGPKPLWFSIDSEIGESMEGDANFASLISTNLKALKDAEGKIADEVKNEVTEKITALKTARAGTDQEALKTASEALSNSMMKIGEAMKTANDNQSKDAGTTGETTEQNPPQEGTTDEASSKGSTEGSGEAKS